MPIGIGDPIGIKKWFVTWLAPFAVQWCDQSIYDNMRQMHATGPQLAGERLHETANGEFRTAEPQPAATAHAGCRSNKEHDAASSREHVGRRLSRAHETAQGRHSP
jgi:hypothetical protein